MMNETGLALADTATKQRVCGAAGRAAHYYGTAHEWTSEGAREAALIAVANRVKSTPEQKRAMRAASMRRYRRKKARAVTG